MAEEKRIPNPMGFFEKKPDPLDAIRDPVLKAEAVRLCEEVAAKSDPKIQGLRARVIASREKHENNLDSLGKIFGENHPVRLVAERLYSKLQSRQHLNLGRAVERAGEKKIKIIDRAVAVDKKSSQNRERDDERER